MSTRQGFHFFIKSENQKNFAVQTPSCPAGDHHRLGICFWLYAHYRQARSICGRARKQYVYYLYPRGIRGRQLFGFLLSGSPFLYFLVLSCNNPLTDADTSENFHLRASVLTLMGIVIFIALFSGAVVFSTLRQNILSSGWIFGGALLILAGTVHGHAEKGGQRLCQPWLWQ